MAQALATARRELSGRVLAATLRSVRDLDIAEEATADSFLLAVASWPTEGVPRSMEAWLITTAKRRAIDRVRRARTAREGLLRLAGGWSEVSEPPGDVAVIGDDELRMVVLCCDPRIPRTDQVVLTLRLACGISTAALAAVHGVPTPTMAARLTRAKAKLAAAGPDLDLPDDATVDARLPAVAQVVHLAFTLGHTAADGTDLSDEELQDHAQYLAQVLHSVRPRDPELTGLLALIWLTRARAATRVGADGDQVLLAGADRRLWDWAQIERGLGLLTPFVADPGRSPMVLQALIAAEHSRARRFADTDWRRILALYDALLTVAPAPLFGLGRAIALGHLAGPDTGLADLEQLESVIDLSRHPYAAAARGYLLDLSGRREEAMRAWSTAAALARTAAERRHFAARTG